MDGGGRASLRTDEETIMQCPSASLSETRGHLILDTYALDVAISGFLQDEQEVDGKIKVRPLAYGSKMLNATERRFGAAKAEMLAAVQFIEKFRSHWEGREFVLRVDNQDIKRLMTYSMSSDIDAR